MSGLAELSKLIHQRNTIGSEIAALIGRPAEKGHVGEYVASQIFAIALEDSATKKSIDGHFTVGPLAGRSVNVKWYAKREGILDLTPDSPPDFYLVLAGPISAAMSSRGSDRPWLIESVHLFAAHKLVETLRARGLKLGVATSVRQELWHEAEIYPVQRVSAPLLTAEEREKLALFSAAR